MQWVTRLHRIEHAGMPVYIDQEKPDWFVPSTRTDELLRACQKHGNPAAALVAFCNNRHEEPDQAGRDLRRLEYLLDRGTPPPYQGRRHHLRLGPLKEIWFHLTDTCNLSCVHCLFSASPSKKETIEREQLHDAIDQATALGSHLFYFTGGEPFVYPDFCQTIQYVLQQDPAHHVAILTNGLLLEEHLAELMAMDHERIHLQVSLDGLQEEHDFLRGRNTYSRLCENLQAAVKAGLAFTISVAVNNDNVGRLDKIARQAHALGAGGLHLMYHFVRGKGTSGQFVPVVRLFSQIVKTTEVCRELGMKIDNLEAMKAQVFAVPGSRFDLTNMAWESLAVAPDGIIYPSPALIRVEALACGHLGQGLADVWKDNIMLRTIRLTSLIDAGERQQRPLVFITGGGDPDHSWNTGHELVGHDPYIDLYEQLALQLITDQAAQYPDQGLFRLRMGDVRHDCPDTENGSDGSVGLTHCNCLVSLAEHDGHSSVREFYSAAAQQANTEIVNPFNPAAGLGHYIPEEAKEKSYGCGSPVKDAAPQKGETVVDLGSGSGVECFLAATEVGATGRVYGIDMTDAMLELARNSKQHVVTDLGYDNIEFRKGYLEAIPLDDATADVVISNCVINLSPDKRKTYLEIMRILKPGGRLVVADVVSDEPVSAAIKNSTKYRGECLAVPCNRMILLPCLRIADFLQSISISAIYREVDGHRFYSLTYEAGKAEVIGLAELVDEEEENKGVEKVRCLFRGPAPALVTSSGQRLERGRITELPRREAEQLGEQIFLLDEEGAVANIEQEACCCGVPPEEAGQKDSVVSGSPFLCHLSGCTVCGEELVYQSDSGTTASCYFCETEAVTPCTCTAGHYVCDSCHQLEGLAVVRSVCLNSTEKDVIGLMNRIRNHPSVPMHGPEHHALVPGVILAAYRNNGGAISRDIIATGIDRGSNVPGGACGFWGCCGAAIGAGIAASLILEATPLKADERQHSLGFTAEILAEIAKMNAGRCCQRDSWLALSHASRLSEEFFGIALPAEAVLHCNQYEKNRECIRKRCPLWEEREWKEGRWRGGQLKKGVGQKTIESILPYSSST
ncbi:Radical SAM superfamily enzyme, MoaA/NifB/PqqE/SkfB family [Candidatus Electrothrix aarhusensis]|uniref:Radical SAM superfamily enzyme, MoaA/NifB/PqqE/SkfB family n=1 Tax=Candidatus Electrothrix aarhusensis TaxID=1859131 RepID=A0A3S4TDI7_9BACT|nr:Radical SAM superfamily enzyme, MoaA/NifB/PqqE/SkfB family [Candidatus Electrothrix aarhusensis]